MANCQVVIVMYETIALHLTLHTPWGAVVLDPELSTATPGCNSVPIVRRVALDNPELNLDIYVLLLATGRKTFPLSGLEKFGNSSSLRVALLTSASENVVKVKRETDRAVEKTVVYGRRSSGSQGGARSAVGRGKRERPSSEASINSTWHA